MAQDGKKLDAPEIGAYRYGTMTEAVFAKSKFKHHEVKLIGDWEGEGLGYWYAPWKAAIALARAGLLNQLPGDGKKFDAVTGYRFCIYRVEGEDDAHDWTAIAYDAQQQQIALGPFPDPVEPQEGAQAAPPPPGQPGGPLVAGTPGQPGAPVTPPPQLSGAPSAPAGPPQQEGPASGNPPPTTNQSTAEQRKDDKAKRERQTLAKVDGLYGLALVVAAYQQVRFFNVPVVDLEVGSLQAGAATVMISLEKNGYDFSTDRRPAYLKRLRRLEYQLFPDRCPDPDADAKPAEEEKPKRRSRAKPKEEKPEPEPKPVSTVPAAESLGESLTDGLEDGEDDDLPF
ncbi:hypothetical protein LCGC14_1317590 [marine sediment metagenome]|uniref:Uncharacterized protein n=1 Tax=marine sediment metagenome TaxID=412755 RepID=A0A0F9N1A6_9ZZZZ